MDRNKDETIRTNPPRVQSVPVHLHPVCERGRIHGKQIWQTMLDLHWETRRCACSKPDDFGDKESEPLVESDCS